MRKEKTQLHRPKDLLAAIWQPPIVREECVLPDWLARGCWMLLDVAVKSVAKVAVSSVPKGSLQVAE